MSTAPRPPYGYWLDLVAAIALVAMVIAHYRGWF